MRTLFFAGAFLLSACAFAQTSRLPEKVRKELEAENRKDVLTADIDHFWQACDALKKCKTRKDSIQTIQTLYLDRATDGLLDFMQARQFTAERFVNVLSKYPRFYASVRANTYASQKAAPYVQQVFDNFKTLYPHFKPFKVCFAIGLLNTGGTVSNQFVLIGAEVTFSNSGVDLSEFNNSAYSQMLAADEDLVQKVKNMVAHECVHTQQPAQPDSNAVECPLLYDCMQEGFCDFIGELVVGSQINASLQEYGNSHEQELWTSFKNELCNQDAGNWLYNYNQEKVKADMGYYIGYRIAQSYYKQAADKQQAVIDIIEMNNPLEFLNQSGYDNLPKK